MTDQQTERENFIAAVEEDEYAELPLGDGYVLITDWEGDGTFLPYVHPPEDDDGDSHQQVCDLLTDADLSASSCEYSEGNGVYYPNISRPTA